MRQLAVRAVSLAPLLEQGEDLLHFLSEEPMHRGPTRGPVDQLAAGSTGEPAVDSDLADLEHTADPSDRPPGLDSIVEQVQQAGLGGRIHAAWDTAT